MTGKWQVLVQNNHLAITTNVSQADDKGGLTEVSQSNFPGNIIQFFVKHRFAAFSFVVLHQSKFLIPSHTETQSRREWGMYRRPFSPKLGVTGASQALPRPIQSSFWGGDRSLKRRNSGWTGVLREGYRAGNLPVGWRGEGWGPTRQYQYPATSISANIDILQY